MLKNLIHLLPWDKNQIYFCNNIEISNFISKFLQKICFHYRERFTNQI